MINNPAIHNRRSIRLRGYDYTKPGSYFITICTQDRDCLFGHIADDRMVLNAYGRIIQVSLRRLTQKYPHTDINPFMIMPNHVHAIIHIHDDGRGGVTPPLQKPALGTMVAYFKYQTTKEINILRNSPGQKIWQRNYYEHVIRNERSRNRISEYITTNPSQWDTDEYNT